MVTTKLEQDSGLLPDLETAVVFATVRTVSSS